MKKLNVTHCFCRFINELNLKVILDRNVILRENSSSFAKRFFETKAISGNLRLKLVECFQMMTLFMEKRAMNVFYTSRMGILTSLA